MTCKVRQIETLVIGTFVLCVEASFSGNLPIATSAEKQSSAPPLFLHPRNRQAQQILNINQLVFRFTAAS